MPERLGAKLWMDSMTATCYSAKMYRLDYRWAIAPRKLNHNVLWYVREGRFTFAVDGESFRAESGDLAFLPANAVAASRAIGETIELCSVNFDAEIGFFPSKAWSDWVPVPAKQRAPERVRDAMSFMAELDASDAVTRRLTLQGHMLLLLGALIESALESGGRADDALPIADAQIAGIAEYIVCSGERMPSVAELCELARLGESQLRKRFKQATGMSPLQYVHFVKLEQAKRALERRDERVSDVARRLGFEDANYFSRLFKRWAGCSPQDYRERSRGF
ncbi:helix-turn-helix transcriptional regulator [Paenibacillus antri]|uniref:Helix-turn-helix transcriptional regulator n=1 Tax=Paenibacillus antri TaxID=2582848 RepID=A0A5R9G881_9BACL|nr:AraC family transcriptional regulator [Paenibacillus antri]TLS52627.1 helix-turn-helix transcriptional regulator [Paenibacillus antri]